MTQKTHPSLRQSFKQKKIPLAIKYFFVLYTKRLSDVGGFGMIRKRNNGFLFLID